MSTKIIKNIFIFALTLFCIYIFIDYLNRVVTPELIVKLIEPWGVLAPAAFFLFLCSTNVIPPFPVVPFWLVALSLFDRPKAILIVYLANITGNTFNFLIARFLGKPVVAKIVGKNGMTKIEELTQGIINFREFLIIRVFGGGLTDYISYAAGFTDIKLLNYVVVTIFGIMPVTFLGILMLESAILNHGTKTILTLSIFYLINYITALLVPALIISKNQRNKQVSKL